MIARLLECDRGHSATFAVENGEYRSSAHTGSGRAPVAPAGDEAGRIVVTCEGRCPP